MRRCDAALGLTADGFDDAAVEALDETVGLRLKGLVRRCSISCSAQTQIEGMFPGGLVSGGLPFMSTAKRSVNSLPLSVRMV